MPIDRTDPIANCESPVAFWPDPSPLDQWWTEIMDGVPPRVPAGDNIAVHP